MKKTLCLALLLVALGCGSIARSLGDECTSDGQCESGLACKPNFVAGQCTTTKTCTTTCTKDSDCEAVDPKGKCFQGCGTEQICMLTP